MHPIFLITCFCVDLKLYSTYIAAKKTCPWNVLHVKINLHTWLYIRNDFIKKTNHYNDNDYHIDYDACLITM